MNSNKLLNYDRNIVFVSGSNYSGKSLMGHMLAHDENCLYNYACISPDEYFQPNGDLKGPKSEILSKLVKDIKTVCFYLKGGDHVHEKERWLRDDFLYGYDYDNFETRLLETLNTNLNLAEFYLLWDRLLQLSRINGTKTTFSVFEVENIYEYKNIIFKEMQNAKFIDIVRKPFKQICSQKIDILMRGPKKNFSGALSSTGNIFLKNLIEMIDQYSISLASINNAKNYYLNLEDLRNLSHSESESLSFFIFGENKMKFVKNLKNASRQHLFENKYISFKSANRSYFQEDRQSHHQVKIDRNNINKFMFFFEKELYKYIDFYGDTTQDFSKIHNYMVALRFILSFPLFLLLSFIAGFKDLKRPFNLLKNLKSRINCFSIMWNVGLKVTLLILKK